MSRSVRISERNLDYLKSMQADHEAEEGYKCSLDDMIFILIQNREELMAK